MKQKTLQIAAALFAALGFAPQAFADTDILTAEQGYQKIKNMPENLGDYYFIIVDKDKDLMMTQGAANKQRSTDVDKYIYKAAWYMPSADPATDLSRVWTVEANNHGGTAGYGLRGALRPSHLMQPEGFDGAWAFRTKDITTTPNEWAQYLLAYNEEGEYWTIQNARYTNDGYVGPWNDVIEAGAEMAGNKKDAAMGRFLFYAITKGDFDYIEQAGIDLKRGVVYFIASPDNFTQRYLYSAKLFGDGTVKRLSPTDEAGQHQYNISPDGSWAVHAFSNAVTPPVIDMVSLPSHKSVRTIEDNAQAKAEYKALKLQPKEFVKTRSGELELDAWMIKPIDFDPAKKYPVIIDVYGEPGSATVQDVWGGGDLWHQYLANQGYIVVSIENRGARTPRGREWRKCIYGEVGTFASQDQAQGILDLARQYSFIDTSRIGITGWSGGGSQTLNCMFRYPDVFHTGIAIAFVADQRLYDTIYQERYMNTPQNNPDGYRKGSPISYAEGLKGNLLLIHGTGDDNVHYQNCERLVNELVRHGKIFSQISYPMRTHSISEGEGTTMHLRKTMTDYFLKHLPAGGR